MNSSSVMAVIVSFNGGAQTLVTIDALIDQVDHIHIVDNASSVESRGMLEKYSGLDNISFTWLEENKGIGYALNIGVRLARTKGYNWLLTMDQDSVAETDMVLSYIEAVNKNPDLTCLGTNYLGQMSDKTGDVELVEYVITSGNIVNLGVYDKIGLYDEDLFIDGVDFDFSLRVRKANIKIYMVKAASMHHELGEKACTFPVIGKFHTYHSPLRRYYMFRNFLYLFERYAIDFPGFMVKFSIVHLFYIITVVLFGGRRLKSLTYMFYGFTGYINNEKGAYKKSG